MIRLVFEENDSGHDDLVLRFAGSEHRCDTYYFAIDDDIDSGDESNDKTRRVIHAMLTQWLSVVETAANPDTVYLPFDFSDQCTGWIRCTFEEEIVQLDAGWSSIEGHSFSPSKIVAMARKVTDFDVIENTSPIMMNRHSLVTAITSNIEDYE